MTDRMKKKREKVLIREFCGFLGLPVRRIVSKKSPYPDAWVSTDIGGKVARLGIEVTDYYSDAAPGQPSSGAMVSDIWFTIRDSICRRTLRRMALRHVAGSVHLHPASLPRKKDTRAVAAELVALALEHRLRPKERRVITQFPRSYPLLQKHVTSVELCEESPLECLDWQCTNLAGSIGLNANAITRIVKRKAGNTYIWDKVDQRWLLIAAVGWPMCASAGPRHQSVDWDDQNLMSACRAAGFDRIYFWDRAYCWYREVFPGAAVVEKERCGEANEEEQEAQY